MTKKPKNKTGAKSTVGHKVEVIHVSTSQVAYLFGISDRQVRNWTNQMGCPKLDHGLFDLKAVLDWWVESDLIGSRLESSDDDIKSVKLETMKEKLAIVKVERKKAEGTVAEIQEVEDAWGTRAVEFTRGLEFLEHRLPPLLKGKTELEMKPIIRKETRAIRENYVRKGKFCE